MDFELTNSNVWYVSSSGDDDNDCQAPFTSCATINGAIGKASSEDTIYITSGIYTGSTSTVVTINKNITLAGGWDSNYTTQSGLTVIDGQSIHRGAIINSGVTANINHLKFSNGEAQNEGSGSYGDHCGGGILNLGTLNLSDSIIEQNNAKYGGGIFNNESATLTLTNSQIKYSSAEQQGGGLFNRGTTTINSSTININSSHLGGGLLSEQTLYMNNTTISGNAATSGGGIYRMSGNATINNNTITDNIAGAMESPFGGGIYSNSNGSLEIKNSNAYESPDCQGVQAGSIQSGGYNLIGNSDECQISATTGDVFGTKLNPIDPKLNSLQDNGGATPTHAPQSGSPAIDTGNPATPGSGGNACLASDQHGTNRPDGQYCDIGSVEGSISTNSFTSIRTYSAGNGTNLPGTLLCDQTQPNCTNGTDLDADAVHQYTIDTLDFYENYYGRNSLDDNYKTVISTVHYNNNYQNAYWSGSQAVFGDNFVTDDIVAHELTHGVTENESNLIFLYQSGAINESFSDLWGEFVDLTNGSGDDSPGVRWLHGEDLSSGTHRSMSDPPAYGDPDKITSPYYYTGIDDLGGVHTNSGVNNKAVYLMTDGDNFNGRTVTGIGLDKTAAIYYEVQTNLLSSGANYTDLYYALNQACSNLIGGSEGITSGDCTQVQNATQAVEMNLPVQPPMPMPDACPSGWSESNELFFDNMETGTDNWVFNQSGQNVWTREPFGLVEPGHSLFGENIPTINSSYAAMSSDVTLPYGAYRLSFKHYFDLEADYDNTTIIESYDGAVLEYSTNQGVSWTDARPLFYAGQDYNAILSSDWGIR